MSEEHLKVLVDAWISFKYWNSCCEDEAIYWSNHQCHYELTLKELQEFIPWRDKMIELKNRISKLLNANQYEDMDKILLAL